MMEQDISYIKRTIRIDGQRYTQDKLLESSKVIVVLAEPGAGKTELLENLASELSTSRIRASIFRHKEKMEVSKTLVIDGLDEVAKIDQSAIDALIVKASELEPERIIFASRSAQWEAARSQTIKDIFGQEPIIANLHPLNKEEQKSLFISYKPDQEFDEFNISLEKLDIGDLLSNPQMLKTFADAYVHSGGILSSKQQVFIDAVEYLASEKNYDQLQSNRPATSTIVMQSDELFCKILLSGCGGVSSTEAVSDSEYPYISELITPIDQTKTTPLETGLFKPADMPDQHEPIHRIIAEYSAARYLVRRIQAPSDRLSLKRVMSLIAPNNTPRDELRGLLAWMASEGDSTIEQAVIKIDPYAILSNGDPSQLSVSSKSFLLNELVKLSDQNPYFRGEDVWRHFSAVGFFTNDIVETIRTILQSPTSSIQLQQLLLELLQDTPAAKKLEAELKDLLLNTCTNEVIRILALRNLHTCDEFDPNDAFSKLMKEQTSQSLPLAAELVEKHGVSMIGHDHVLCLLNLINEVYFPKKRTTHRGRLEEYSSLYFISNLILSFGSYDVEQFLSELSQDLTCDCERKKYHDCFCRYGRSLFIGKLLDRLFELDEIKPNAEQILKWTKGVRYKYGKGREKSSAVAALQNNNQLRQEVQRLIFGGLTNKDQIRDHQFGLNINDGHSGLIFINNDIQVLMDYAFEKGNVVLWSCFIPQHRMYERKNFKNPLRTHVRQQAHERTEFGRIWARRERAWKKYIREERSYSKKHSAQMRKHRKRKLLIRTRNQKHFDENKALIESGRHWEWLRIFSEGYLRQNNKHFPEMDDNELPIKALYNCLDFLLPNIPDLKTIAENEGTFHIITVAHAACLIHFRKHGNLASVNKHILRAVITEASMQYSGGNNDDRETFESEIARQIFQTSEDIEIYARQSIEPQLADPTREHTDVGWLAYREPFHPLRASLPIEWLERFPEIRLNSVDTLFSMAARYGDRERLIKVIENQIHRLGSPPNVENELVEYDKVRDFWFLRRFFFLDQCDAKTTSWLQEKKEHVLSIYHINGWGNREDNQGWSDLNARKILLLLETYFDKWPKVHLPSSWGTGDPPEQTAYRFLTEIVGRVGNDTPENAIPVIDQLMNDTRFDHFQSSLKAQRAAVVKKIALRDFSPPTPKTLVEMLDNQQIATVEDLRALLLELLDEIQNWVKGAETDPVKYFYNKPKSGEVEHIDENAATRVIVDRLQLQCKALGLSSTIEHHLHDGKRSDMTIRINLDGIERLLVTEAKGQWHRELYTAAAEQLENNYTIHPDAAHQGVYLVYWFGEQYKVAGIKKHGIKSAQELQQKIFDNMPVDLRSRIDVFVLDVSL